MDRVAQPFDSRDLSPGFLMKSHIVTVAERMCSSRDLRGITVKEICEEASISRPTFYRHFRGKEDIAIWIITRICARHFGKIGYGCTWESAISGIAEELSSSATNLLDSAAFASTLHDGVRAQAADIGRSLTNLCRARGVRVTSLLQDQADLYALSFVTLFIEYATSERWSRLSPDEFGGHLASFVPRELRLALQST